MKKIISSIREFENIYLVALCLIGAATFTACSSDDAVVEQQPETPATGKYTMTIKASKGDDPSTRGLSLDGTTLKVKWNEGEKVEVYQAQNQVDVHLGTLYAEASEDAETTLTGTLDVAPNTDEFIYFYLNNSYNKSFSGQKGVLLSPESGDDYSIEKNYDYAKTFVNKDDFTVSGDKITVPKGITLRSLQSIVKFTLQKADGSQLIANSLTIQDYALNSDAPSFISLSPLVVSPTDATDELYVAISGLDQSTKYSDIVLTATTTSGDTYTYTKLYEASSPVYFEHGSYYSIAVKMIKSYTTFQMNDVIKVGERFALTEEWKINENWYMPVPGTTTYTLIRANIEGTYGNKDTVTEDEDGAFYVVRRVEHVGDGTYTSYYFDDQTLPVTATSDGLEVTAVSHSGTKKSCTLAVHQP